MMEALDKAVNDILNGNGIPRIDRKTGSQTVFRGNLDGGQYLPKWDGALEWEVIPGNNDLRVATKMLPNGQIQVGLGYPHWERIFDVVLTHLPE